MTFFLLIGTQYASHAQGTIAGQLRLTKEEVIGIQGESGTVPGSSNYSAVKVISIFGDPSKPQLYTILLKVAGNTKIAAHLHPDQRMATVISGTWYFGYGDKFDSTSLKKLPPGSIYSEVAGQNHFAMTKEPVVVEITGFGPSGVTYFDAADDPATKKK